MHRPVSTYRLQLHAKFGFAEAREVLAYLDALGISDIYSSPYLQAGHGSMHGYDVVDPTRLNGELGKPSAYRAFSDEMHKRKLGHVLDIVPNHMSIADGNAWWWDVLEHGPSSLYANHFDIDWSPPKKSLHGRVLLPVLGGQFSEVLERGELRLVRKGGAVELSYDDHTLPLAPPSLAPILLALEERLGREPGADASSPARAELRSVARALKNLPESVATPREERLERKDEVAVIKRRLETLLARSFRAGHALDALLAEWNGQVGAPRSFDKLEQLLAEQRYRLADWRVAAEEINYRRFFDVNQLIALRMEDPAVFDDTHALIFQLLAEGRASGVRLDHTDGLRDPAEYFRRLRARTREPLGCYIVAEKILERREQLPPAWPLDGTTGYDFMNPLCGLFVDARAEEPLTALYRDFTGDGLTFAEHAMNARRLVMRASLPSEVHVLTDALEGLSQDGKRPRDFTRAGLQSAITETIAAFPVYRTYLRGDGSCAPDDRGHIDAAIELAKSRNPALDAALFDFLREVLLLNPLPGADGALRAEQLDFVLRFQQLTPPMMAKGVEDTAFYTYRRFLMLNEVGGDPGQFGTSPAAFHAANFVRRRDWPRSMLASSTHDNKRGEDARARLACLSELPAAWARAVAHWSGKLERHKRRLRGGARAPGRDDEYLFFQTLVGALPFDGRATPDFAERIAAYMKKAAREAKQRTSWLMPDGEYEQALEGFVRGALGDAGFLDSLCGFTRALIPGGIVNSLAQVALKLCSPGVADTYQGCEDWNLSLVDPDNRRPVDYHGLEKRLHKLRKQLGNDRRALCKSLLARAIDGDIKLYISHILLSARRLWPELFLDGDYRPVEAGEQVVAFARKLGARALVCAVPRLCLSMTRSGGWPLGAQWGERALDLPVAGPLRDLFTGQRHAPGRPARLADLFADFPAAVLISEPA